MKQPVNNRYWFLFNRGTHANLIIDISFIFSFRKISGFVNLITRILLITLKAIIMSQDKDVRYFNNIVFIGSKNKKCDKY